MRIFIVCSTTSPWALETNGVNLESHKLFLFLLLLRPEQRGDPRATYLPAQAGWPVADAPRPGGDPRGARSCVDHLLTSMFAIDGAPRITNI